MRVLDVKTLSSYKKLNLGFYLIPVATSINLSGVHVKKSEMVHMYNVSENTNKFTVGFNVLYGGTRQQAGFGHSFNKGNDSTMYRLRHPYKNEWLKFSLP